MTKLIQSVCYSVKSIFIKLHKELAPYFFKILVKHTWILLLRVGITLTHRVRITHVGVVWVITP